MILVYFQIVTYIHSFYIFLFLVFFFGENTKKIEPIDITKSPIEIIINAVKLMNLDIYFPDTSNPGIIK